MRVTISVISWLREDYKLLTKGHTFCFVLKVTTELLRRSEETCAIQLLLLCVRCRNEVFKSKGPWADDLAHVRILSECRN